MRRGQVLEIFKHFYQFFSNGGEGKLPGGYLRLYRIDWCSIHLLQTEI